MFQKLKERSTDGESTLNRDEVSHAKCAQNSPSREKEEERQTPQYLQWENFAANKTGKTFNHIRLMKERSGTARKDTDARDWNKKVRAEVAVSRGCPNLI